MTVAALTSSLSFLDQLDSLGRRRSSNHFSSVCHRSDSQDIPHFMLFFRKFIVFFVCLTLSSGLSRIGSTGMDLFTSNLGIPIEKNPDLRRVLWQKRKFSSISWGVTHQPYKANHAERDQYMPPNSSPRDCFAICIGRKKNAHGQFQI